jgi:hypothetical protein
MGVEGLDLDQVSYLWLHAGTEFCQVCRLGCSVAEVEMSIELGSTTLLSLNICTIVVGRLHRFQWGRSKV